MFSVLISVAVSIAVFLTLRLTGTAGAGWSAFFGIAAYIASQIVIGRIMQKRVKAVMAGVQAVMSEGEKKLQAATARWQVRQPGSVQEALNFVSRERRKIIDAALERSKDLEQFIPWVPLMPRQIATLRFQLYWMVKEFSKVDALMKKALFTEPIMAALRIARMQMLNIPTEQITRSYEKAVRRLRYNQNALLAAEYSWILLKRGDADGAFKALNKALEKSDNETLKINRDHLANNRLSHFSNAGLGDMWWALHLEEPKIKTGRQRMKWH